MDIRRYGRTCDNLVLARQKGYNLQFMPRVGILSA